MQVKNISSSLIEIQDLNIKLRPGETADLSGQDLVALRTHKVLNLYFDKGLLANLGRVHKPTGSKAALNAARDRIEKMGIMGKNKLVVKQATRNDVKKTIADLTRKSDPHKKLSPPPANFSAERERYRDVLEEDYEDLPPKPKTRPKIQEKFQPVVLDWPEFGANGMIETGVITGETTMLNQEPTADLSLMDRKAKEHRISFEVVRDKILRKCIGLTSSGKPCKKYAVHGFQSCLTHMNRTEKEEYERLQKQQKSS